MGREWLQLVGLFTNTFGFFSRIFMPSSATAASSNPCRFLSWFWLRGVTTNSFFSFPLSVISLKRQRVLMSMSLPALCFLNISCQTNQVSLEAMIILRSPNLSKSTVLFESPTFYALPVDSKLCSIFSLKACIGMEAKSSEQVSSIKFRPCSLILQLSTRIQSRHCDSPVTCLTQFPSIHITKTVHCKSYGKTIYSASRKQ